MPAEGGMTLAEYAESYGRKSCACWLCKTDLPADIRVQVEEAFKQGYAAPLVAGWLRTNGYETTKGQISYARQRHGGAE